MTTTVFFLVKRWDGEEDARFDGADALEAAEKWLSHSDEGGAIYRCALVVEHEIKKERVRLVTENA